VLKGVLLINFELKLKKFQKSFFPPKIDIKNDFRNGFSKRWVFWKAYDFYFAKNTTRGKNRWIN